MPNSIQIKRGTGTPPVLAAGEPALDQDSSRLYIGTESGQNIEFGPINNVAYSYMSIWAEEAGGLSAGAHQWSYGNGAVKETLGVPVPHDCELFAGSFVGDGQVVIQVKVNDVAVADISTQHDIFATPIQLNAGDKIGFVTLSQVGTTSHNIVVAHLRFEAARGVLGHSAYQVWLDAGNVGTENDFLSAIQGPPGNNGTSGFTRARMLASHTASSISIKNLNYVIAWDTLRKVDADFSYLNQMNTACLFTGWVDVNCTIQVTGNNRVELISYVQLNGVNVEDSRTTNYALRDADQNTGSVHLMYSVQVSYGDEISIYVEGDADGDVVIDQGTRLMLERVE